jgi:hypothetical protein
VSENHGFRHQTRIVNGSSEEALDFLMLFKGHKRGSCRFTTTVGNVKHWNSAVLGVLKNFTLFFMNSFQIACSFIILL